MSSLSLAWHSVWFARVIAHAVLLVLILKRRLYTEFPIFTAYTLGTVLFSWVLLAMNYAPAVKGYQYFQAFTTVEATTAALSLAVIYEILQHIFRNYPSLVQLGVPLFRCTTLLLLACGIVFAWFAPAAGPGTLLSTFFVYRRSVDILICGLLVLLCMFSSYFGVPRRSYLFGIALGMGLISSVSLASTAIESQIEPVTKNYTINLLKLINQTAFLGGILIWTAYLMVSERTPSPVPDTLPTHELEDWNRELERLS